jgi:hypothetical protein
MRAISSFNLLEPSPFDCPKLIVGHLIERGDGPLDSQFPLVEKE